jgi:hypothetical protein
VIVSASRFSDMAIPFVIGLVLHANLITVEEFSSEFGRARQPIHTLENETRLSLLKPRLFIGSGESIQQAQLSSCQFVSSNWWNAVKPEHFE